MHPKIAAAVILISISAGRLLSAAPVQWPISSGGNGHWYEAVYVSPSGISWTDAEEAAVASGGYLACITSAAENNFVYNLIASDNQFWSIDNTWGNMVGPWLGGYKYNESAAPSDGWAWVNGAPWVYTNWASGEPNNFNGQEFYLAYFSDNTTPASTWNDCPIAGYPNWNAISTGYIVEFNSLTQASTWAAAVSGSWSKANNWTGAVPNGVGGGAVINASTTAALTITIDAPQTLGTLLLGNSARLASAIR